ncbi:MAG: M48 family metallopeptidase [Bacillota bacterium]
MIPVLGHIAANKRRTFFLFFLFALLFGAVGYFFGLYIGEAVVGLVLAGLIFLILILISYYAGQGVVTAMAGAHPADRNREPYLYNIVEALSIAAGRPVPRIYIIETGVPNAFAAGRNPKHAVIGVTRGLLNRLNRLELEGVIAHEMAHINNYDVLLATVAIVMAGTVVFLSDAVRRILWFGGGRRGSRRDGGGQAQLIALIILIILAILAPLFAQLLKFAISRQREFLADATAAEFTGYPEGLATALEKITQSQLPNSPIDNKALQGLYIVNPALGARGAERVTTLFSTHPSTAERVKRLREM